MGTCPARATPHRVMHGLEQQPCGVQVVEWVGLVACGFQFLSRLAAVFLRPMLPPF